jgi:HEAT repeat protein
VPALLLAIAFVSSAASASLWPTPPDDIARGLADDDVAARRAAASRLADLPLGTASPLVALALEDADVDVRLHAARAAMALHMPEAPDRILGWLSESDARLRLAACELIRAMPTSRAVAPLARVLGDANADVRRAAAATLGVIGDPQAVPSLLGHLDDPSPEARTEVVVALGRIGDPRAVVPLLGKAQDASPDVRRMTVRVLGDLGDPRAASALMLALRDKIQPVRVEAIESLGRLKAQEAVPALSPLAVDKSSIPVRSAAAIALARIGTPPAVDALMAALETDDPNAERSSVRHALVQVGSAAIPRLVDAVRVSSSPAKVSGACLVLGELHAPGSATVIVDAVQRGLVPAQTGLRALATLGESSALPFVLELLDNSSAPVRRAAIEAAGALLDPSHPDGRAVDPIVARLRDASLSTDEQVALVALLGKTGAPRAAAILMELASSKDRPLTVAALQALGSVGQAGQDALLVDALGDADPNVRLRAAISLSRVAAPRTAAILLDRLERASEQDRASIGIALSGAMAASRDDVVAQRAAGLLSVVRESARDVLIEGLGRMSSPEAGARLAFIARTAVLADDRRKVAEALVQHPEQLPALRELASDSDPSVQANAAWSLGQIGQPSDRDLLASLMRHRDVAVAANAVGAWARLVVSRKLSDMAPVCAALEDPRPYVRANALATLALTAKRCGDGARERSLLVSDPSAVVRAAAARAVRAVPAGDGAADRRMLRRCAMDDRSGLVAVACHAGEPSRVASAEVTEPVVVFVVPDGSTSPVARLPFALVLADGLMRVGLADRRGAVFEARAPRGRVELAIPAAMAR